MNHVIDIDDFLNEGAGAPEGHRVLYRGDSAPIDFFELAKTAPNNRFGIGFYFTESLPVAKGYSVMGQDVVLWKGPAWSLRHATKKFIEQYLLFKVGEPVSDAYKEIMDNEQRWKQYKANTPEPEYRQRLITAYKEFDRIEDHITLRRFDKNRWIAIDRSKPTGHITKMVVPEDYLTKCYDTESPLEGTILSSLLDALRQVGDEESAKYVEMYKSYIEQRSVRGRAPLREMTLQTVYPEWVSFNSEIRTPEGQQLFRSIFQNEGYVGIRYDGDRSMGFEKHNAYVFWDEKQINEWVDQTEGR